MTFKVKDGLALGAVTIIDFFGNITVPEKLTLSNTTTTRSSLNIGVGTSDPSSPVNGDLWVNSGVLKIQQSAATKTLAYTDSNITGTASTASNLIGGNNTTLLGSIPYQSNTNTTALVTPNTTITKKFLRQTGTGTNGAVPSWDTLVDSDIPSVLTGKSYNRLNITAPATGSTLTIAEGKTLTANNTLTLNGTDGSSVAFGTGGSVAYTGNKLSVFAATTSAELAGVISDETGSGALVFANTPTLVTPNIGAAAATSINGISLTANASGFSLAGGTTSKTLSLSNTLTFNGTDGSSVAFGTGGTVTYTGNKLSVFAATTSAELAGVISDETGSGALVFATTPTFTTNITTPLINGSSAASGSLSLSSTSSVTKGTVFVGGTGDTIRLNTTTNGFVKVSSSNGTISYDASTYYSSGGTDVPVTDGGTGTSTAPSAGGIIYGASTSSYASTVDGTAGAILTSGGVGAPSWTLATYPSSVVTGDILYASANNTLSKLAIGSPGTVLRSNGTNVSWAIDVNTYPETWTWTDGTVSGPTAVISGTSPNITVAAVPAASGTASGIITTGTQTIAGAKTFSSNITGTISNATTAAGTAQAITFNSAGTGNGSGTTFNGGTAVTISHNSIGAAAASHAHGNISNDGAVGVTANLPLITTTSGVVTTGSFGTTATALGSSSPGSANSFARSDHAHAMITSQAGTAGTVGTVSISGTTIGVTLGTTSTSASRGDHAHGNISNAGAVGVTANLPLITTTSGVVTTGSFGSTAFTFCQGNDSRLSDARAANGGTSSEVTINYNNDPNSSYQMLWGSGNAVYGTAGITCNPFTDTLTVGALYSNGNVTAYSDESLKTNWRDLQPTFISDLAAVKTGVYDRTDNDETQVGVSAQSLKPVLPNAVVEGENGLLSVAYGNAALAAAVMLARKVEELEARLAALESK